MGTSTGWQEGVTLAARLYLVASVTMVAGLTSSIIIYLTAGNMPGPDSGVDVEECKEYIHALELYGGKANVLAVEVTKWFDGMWHGTSLAFTIGFMTIVTSLGLFLVAYHTASDTKTDEPAGKILG